jgi:hypothetical protein
VETGAVLLAVFVVVAREASLEGVGVGVPTTPVPACAAVEELVITGVVEIPCAIALLTRFEQAGSWRYTLEGGFTAPVLAS